MFLNDSAKIDASGAANKNNRNPSITSLALKDYLVWVIFVVGVTISFPKILIRFFHRDGQMMGKKLLFQRHHSTNTYFCGMLTVSFCKHIFF